MLEGLFKNTVEADFLHLICGKPLGSGAHREVFEFALDPKWVIKFETEAHSFSNINEWQVWQDAQDMHEDISKWLAPCRAISACGTVLIQARTTPAKRYPDQIPAWLTDTKRANFGMLGRRFVAHDYALNLICNSGMTRRLRKVEWW